MQVKEPVDILMTSENKLDENFAQGQVLIDFQNPFRPAHNEKKGGVMDLSTLRCLKKRVGGGGVQTNGGGGRRFL